LVGQSDVFFDGGSGTLTGEYNGIPYEIVQGYAVAQGDMVLGKLGANGKLDIPTQTRGIGQDSMFDRWPDGVIPYQFAEAVSQLQRDRAQQAIAHWNARTKIKMIPRTEKIAENYDNYLSFELSGGCASYVGMKGGEQSVWLADNCTVGSIIHEIGHAIGLFHEHTRVDRDNYVTVNLNNVSAGKEINFNKVTVGASTYSDYDFGSIMHYGEYFFSRNGERSITVPDGVAIGQREALSDLDIESINQMYATDLKLAISTATKEDLTQIDLVVTNTGDLGAYALKLTASWNDAEWVSVSKGSGWNCEQVVSDIHCTRTSMKELSDSSFSMLVDPKNNSIDQLKIRVESRTHDTDLKNNVFNDTISANPATPLSEPTNPTQANPTVAVEPIAPITTANPKPTQQPNENKESAATENNESSTTPSVGAAQGGSGGGGATLYLLTLLLSIVYKRSRTF